MSEDSFVDSPMNVDRSLVLSPCTPVLSTQPSAKPTAAKLASLIFDIYEYQQDIFDYMKIAEMRARAKPYYMRRQPDISYSMRSTLVDWLVEVGEEYKLQNETLYLAVGFIDRFLSQMSVVRAKLQLLGTAAMFVASKYEEIYPPDVTEFVFITDDTYTTAQVLKMEHVILKVLAFDLSVPTTLAFINHLATVCQLSDKTKHLAMFLCELSLVEGDPYLQFRQSLLASAAIACARHCLLEEERGGEEVWPADLESASGYSLKQLAPCMVCLNATHAKATTSPQQAVVDKYKVNKWHNVAEIPHKQLSVEENNEEVILDL
ncbi:G2/mitotic-specific cyclin-A [Nilaparvata lugens]|nr:G2/mitotic-specific cyclin-A [Nilaparvata lugens]